MASEWKIYGANVPIDLNVCYYCQDPIDAFSSTVDHLIPESRGGIRAKKNKVPSCGDCNKLKGDMTPEEFHRAVLAMQRLKSRGYKREMSYLKKVATNTLKLIKSKKG